MFDFLRNKPVEPQPQPLALPEPESAEDEAVKSAIEAALTQREPEPAPPTTIVGADTKIGGSIETDNAVAVAGAVNGDVTCGPLTLEADGQITGDVRACGDVVVSGTVTGNMNVDGKLTIAETGRVLGNVKANAVVIQDGGELCGRCSMGASKPSARESKPAESFIANMFSDDDDLSLGSPALAVVG